MNLLNSVHSLRHLRSVVVTLVTLALITSGFVATSPAFGAAATLTVSAAPSGGGAVTVTGAGFDQNNADGYSLAVAPANYSNYAAAATANALVSGTEYLIQPGVSADTTVSPKIDVLDNTGAFSVSVSIPAPTASGWRVFVTSAGTPTGDTTVRSGIVSYSSVPTPTISVSLPNGATSLEPTATTTVTVTGTGFVAQGASTSTTAAYYAPAMYSGDFGGVYVVFGKFRTGWQPSSSQSSTAANRTAMATAWGVAPANFGIGGITAAGGAFALNADGSFSTTLTVSITAAQDLLDGTYGVYTYGGGNVKYAPFETFTPVTVLPRPTVTVSQTTGLQAGDIVTVTGTGFTARAGTTADGTRPPLSNGSFGGVYIAFGRYADVWKPSAQAASSTRKNAPGAASVKWAVHSADLATIGGANAGGIVVDPTTGNFTAQITVDDNFTNMPSTGNFGIYTYGGGGTKPAAFETYTPITFASPTPPSNSNNSNTEVQVPSTSGYLSWGVKDSFRSYLSGSPGSSITVSNGATASASGYNFGQSGGGYSFSTQTGTADYSGAVRFYAHGGVLNLLFSDPSVVVENSSSGTLYMTVNGSRVALATLNLAAAGRSTSGGAQLYTNAPATLTAAGAGVFARFYQAGESLDPVSFVVGKPGSAPRGSSGVVLASTAKPAFVPPATAPAKTGIKLSATAANALSSGRQATITVDGFQPNETGIAVVVYSTPTVLATDLTANENGEVTWTGSLPANLKGKHTLTVQGSISKGIELTVVGKTSTCEVSNASLDWGFKQSFLAYLDSSIANGTWVLDGVTEEGSVFSWNNGSGTIASAGVTGLVAFPGSIQFLGHDGVLNTTVSNPKIEITENNKAFLLLDVKGEKQEGGSISESDVRFAELDLSGIERSADGLTAANISATLTDAGAAAFGTYPAGTELDAVSFTLPVAVDCGAVVTTNADVDQAMTANGLGLWLVIALIALIMIIAAAVITFVVVRRRKVGAE